MVSFRVSKFGVDGLAKDHGFNDKIVYPAY